MYLTITQIKKLQSMQGTLLKSSLNQSVHSHHSKLINIVFQNFNRGCLSIPMLS